jgi:iron uptake system component EfeO
MFPTARRRAVRALRTPALATTLVAGTLLGGCTGGTHPAASQDVALTINRGSCGQAWSAPSGTPATFQIHNGDTATAEVYLIDPGTGGIFAEIDGLAPGATRPMRVQLGRGDYALRCVAEDTDAATGPTVHLAFANPSAAPAVLPVTIQDMYDTVRRYRAYVTTGLSTLDGDAVGLAAALRAGDLDASRRAWLTAHLAYERLGAAYGTFDDFADKLDGRPDGLPDGVPDADFVGLRRIEYGLWHGESPAALAGTGDRLVADVAALRKAFPAQQTDPADLPLRAHEIMEDAERFELTGAADQGSGTGLATVDANLDGTQAVLDAIAPVLQPRYPGWAAMAASLTATRSLVEAQHHGDAWTAPAALARADRERLDAAVGQLLEQLAPIAEIGEMRRSK